LNLLKSDLFTQWHSAMNVDLERGGELRHESMIAVGLRCSKNLVVPGTGIEPLRPLCRKAADFKSYKLDIFVRQLNVNTVGRWLEQIREFLIIKGLIRIQAIHKSRFKLNKFCRAMEEVCKTIWPRADI
jgi:hypothetical protein